MVLCQESVKMSRACTGLVDYFLDGKCTMPYQSRGRSAPAAARRDDRFLRAKTEQAQPVDRSTTNVHVGRVAAPWWWSGLLFPGRSSDVDRPFMSGYSKRTRDHGWKSTDQRPTNDPPGGSPLAAREPFSARRARPAAPTRARQSRSEEKRRPCDGSTCSCQDNETTRYEWRLLQGVVMERTAKTTVVVFRRASCWSNTLSSESKHSFFTALMPR
jgi:hypothetical protein